MKQLGSIFSWKQSSVSSAAAVMMVMVLLSRILGLVRDRLLAARFAPDVLGVYFAAFRVPNLIFELLVMGALTAAFIPVFTKYAHEESRDQAWKMSSTIIHVCVICFALLSIPMFLFTDTISHLIAPGFTNDQIIVMSQFTRFMILFQVLPLLVGNFFTGILQSYSLFFAPAIAPVVYNIGIIIGVVLFTPYYGLWSPVIGIGIGAILFICVQIPSLLFVGYKHKWVLHIKHPGVIEAGKLMVPRTVGLAVSQVDTTVDLVLSTLLGARMVTVFQFAQHLQQLPIGLFGTTVAQAAFPLLSQASIKNDMVSFKRTVLSATNQILFFVLPISILFIVLRIPIVRLVFGASRFDWEATVLTSMTLSAFSVSLFAQSLSQVFTRAFYALYDSKTPVLVGVITIFLNTIVSILLVAYFHFPVWSLGISTSISSIINVFILFVLLQKKTHLFTYGDVGWEPVKMFIASVLMGIALYIPLKLLDQLVFDTTRISGLMLLTGVTSIIGISWYMFLMWVMGVSEVRAFMKLLEKFRKPKLIFLEPANEVVNNGVSDTPLP